MPASVSASSGSSAQPKLRDSAKASIAKAQQHNKSARGVESSVFVRIRPVDNYAEDGNFLGPRGSPSAAPATTTAPSAIKNEVVCWCPSTATSSSRSPRKDHRDRATSSSANPNNPAEEDRLFFDRGSVLEEYRFRKVFSPADDNLALFNAINGQDAPSATPPEDGAATNRVVASVFSGVHETIFCYGQTSSGKTHSVFGSEDEPGLSHHFIRGLFNCLAEQRRGVEPLVDRLEVRCFEIFGDTLTDLLAAPEDPEEAREVKLHQEQIFLKTQRFKYNVAYCKTAIQCLDLLENAVKIYCYSFFTSNYF